MVAAIHAKEVFYYFRTADCPPYCCIRDHNGRDSVPDCGDDDNGDAHAIDGSDNKDDAYSGEDTDEDKINDEEDDDNENENIGDDDNEQNDAYGYDGVGNDTVCLDGEDEETYSCGDNGSDDDVE